MTTMTNAVKNFFHPFTTFAEFEKIEGQVVFVKKDGKQMEDITETGKKNCFVVYPKHTKAILW